MLCFIVNISICSYCSELEGWRTLASSLTTSHGYKIKGFLEGQESHSVGITHILGKGVALLAKYTKDSHFNIGNSIAMSGTYQTCIGGST